MTRAIFLDRDGTINVDPGYLGNPDLVQLFNGTGEALSDVKNRFGYKLIVVSNQSGIARGLITHSQVISVNEKINEILSKYDVCIDKFMYCPFHPDYSSPEEAKCRKPSPAMILHAAKEYDIDLPNSFMIGDSEADILCAKNAGVKSIMVLTGQGNRQIIPLKKGNNLPNFVVNDISEACKLIKLLSLGV